MRKVKELLPGLIVLAVLGFAVWRLALWLAAFLRGLQSDLAVAIAAAGIAGFVSVLSLVISKVYETRVALNQELRAKKTPVYEGIVKVLFQVMFAEKLGKPPASSDELTAWFVETTEKLSIWGSNDLLKAFDAFKDGFSPDNPAQGLLAFENLIVAIRKDLGHGGNIGRGGILRLFITDLMNGRSVSDSADDHRSKPCREIARFRDTFATTLLAANVPLIYVSSQLGHADPVVTLRHYTRWLPRPDARHVALLDERVSDCASAEAV
jgi:hypothetical protein